MPDNHSKQEKARNIYGDGNIPEIDLQNQSESADAEPLPESTRPRKDGSGGESSDNLIATSQHFSRSTSSH